MAQPCSIASTTKRSDRPQPKTAPGFATLSALQSSDVDVQIYRRFSNLASRNLACLQSELVALEAEIAALDEADLINARDTPNGWMDRDLSARCWEVMERDAKDPSNDLAVLRMSLVRRLRALMAEYQDALLRQSRVLELEKPAARSKGAFKEWFARNRPLVGHSYDLLDSQAAQRDLVALRTSPDQDRLTAFLQDHAGFFFTSKKRDDYTWEGITYFPETAIHVIVSVVSVLITAMLLVGAIVALYYARSPGLKLGLVALFTTVFAAGIGLLTNARKAELYAATAAYAAVLVVYVGNGHPIRSSDAG